MKHFLNPDSFPITELLLRDYATARKECTAATLPLMPWKEGYLYDNEWRVGAFYVHGERVNDGTQDDYPNLHAMCPGTSSMLREINERLDDGLCSAIISAFYPGTRTAKHYHPDGYMYRAHLCLKSDPATSGFAILDESIAWHEGEVTIFDNTIPHESWNEGNTVRINLVLDFLRGGKTRRDLEEYVNDPERRRSILV